MGLLLIVAAAATWGTTGATMKLVAAGSPMSPLLVGFLRVAIAAPCLCLAARWFGGSLRLPDRGDRGRLLLAGLAMGAFQPCYFGGVAKTSVAVGSLIAICSAPLLITVLAAVFLAERIDGRTWAALLAGITGAALLTAGPHGISRLTAGFLTGVALALGAGLSYAVYAVAVKTLVHRAPPLAVAALTFSVAALSLLPALLLERPAADARGWVLLAYLGVVPTAGAYILYVVGLRTTRVTVSGVLTLVEPLTATLLGVLFFGDRLGLGGTLGAALLLSAVLGLTTRR
ncbi:MAG TPA: EamA family transporter [Methylomirabilota bacterium]|jgi:DME family drug/metabolite transporter